MSKQRKKRRRSGDSTKREIVDIRYRTADRAARYALASVLPPGVVELTPKDVQQELQLREAYSKLGDDWRKCLQHLRGIDFEPLRGVKYRYAYRCPEVGVFVDRKMPQPCNLRLICPWCWSRFYVHETFWRLKYALWNTTKSGYIEHKPLAVDLWDGVATELWDWDFAYTPISEMFDHVASLRDQRLDLIAPWALGGFQLFVIEPPDTRADPGYWRLTRRFIVLSPPGADAPEFQFESHKDLREVTQDVRLTAGKSDYGLKQGDLAAPLGRACRYPSQLLFGPRKVVKELLDYRRKYRKNHKGNARSSPTGFRLSSYYGCLRNGVARKEEASQRLLDDF